MKEEPTPAEQPVADDSKPQQDSGKKKDPSTTPSSTIFVKGIPLSATKEELNAFFSEVGPVKWSFLVTAKTQKGPEGIEPADRIESKPTQHLGMGYVQFSIKEDAQTALTDLKKKPFKGQQLVMTLAKPKIKPVKNDDGTKEQRKPKVKHPKPRTNPKLKSDPTKVHQPGAKEARVVLRNLEFSCNEKNVQKAFKKFGEIMEISLPMSETRPNSIKGFGFVQFSKREEAVKAVEEGNGMKLNGRVIVVDLALPKHQFADLMENAKEGLAPQEDNDEDADSDQADEESSESGTDEEELTDTDDELEEVLVEDEEEGENAEEDEEDEEMEEEDSDEEEEETGEESEDQDDSEGEEEVQNSDEEEKPQKKKQEKRESHDTGEGRTVFIRNLLFETTEDELKECFEQFGTILYSKIVRNEFGMSKGTGFVKFADAESAKKCVVAAAVTEQKRVNIGSKYFKSVIQDSHGSGILLGGRVLSVTAAVEREEAKKLEEGNKEKKIKEDKRNLYLAREGAIRADSEAGKSLSKAELAKRAKADQEKKKKLLNPNFFISKTRISVRSLPLTVDDKQLKELALKAVKDRFADKANPEIEMEGAKEPPKILQVKIERSKDRIDSEGKLRSKGFGFVEFQRHAHALAALRQLNNNPAYFGAAKRLTVEFALENTLVLRKREERLKKIKEKQGNTGEKASKATEKRKARRERREERLRLEKVQGKKPVPQKQQQQQTKVGGQAQPAKKQQTDREQLKARKPSQQADAKKAKPKQQVQQQQHLPQSGQDQEERPKKRKRNEQEEKFQKMVNSYKKKLFKSDGEGDSMSRWMS